MADEYTRLSDIIDVNFYNKLPAVNTPETTALWESGLVASSPLLNAAAMGTAKVAELPFWKDLDRTEVNYSNDDPTDFAEAKKVVQGEQIARKAFVNKGWGYMDLSNELSFVGTATQQVKNRYDAYFVSQWQDRLVAAAMGVKADNVANDASDMTTDVASESIAGQSITTLFNSAAFISAAYTLEDFVGQLGAIVVHSHIMQRMATNDEIVYIPDSQGKLTIPTYKGYRVIVSNALTPVAGSTDGFKYTSILFGSGAFGYGEGSADVPVEIIREGKAGGGGGMEELWVRKTWLLHPFGYQSLTTPAATSFTLAELKTAAVWDRIVDRKNIPISFLVTN